MKKWMKQAGEAAPTVLLSLGGAMVAFGIGMVYLPAGIIAAGVLAAAVGILLIKGGGGA